MLMTIIYGWFGVLLSALLALACIPNAEKGITEKLHHRTDELPNVMRGRYAAVFVMSAFIVWYADMTVLMVWGLVMGSMSLYDAYLYKRRNMRYAMHLIPGLMTYVVSALAFATLLSNGDA